MKWCLLCKIKTIQYLPGLKVVSSSGQPFSVIFPSLESLVDDKSRLKLFEQLTTASLSGGGCLGCPGLPLLAQAAPGQSYVPMAGKPKPSSHEPPN